MIAEEYGISGKGQGRSEVFAKILGDRATVLSGAGASSITFDKEPTEVCALKKAAIDA